MPRIVFTLEDYSEIQADLDADVITIGRNDDNTYVLKSGSVSGHHATITKKGNDYYIQDLGSTNGTKLNDVEIEEAKLEEGDFLSVGDIRGLVQLDDAIRPIPADAYVAPVLSSVASLDALSKPRQPHVVPNFSAHRPIPPKRIVDSEPFRPSSIFKVGLALIVAFIIGLHLRHFAENSQVLTVDYIKKLVAGDYGQMKGVTTKPKAE